MTFEEFVVGLLLLGLVGLVFAFADELSEHAHRLDALLHRALGGDR